MLQKLTEAYENKDLVQLLRFQSEYQLDENAVLLRNLREYNAVLQKQVSALEEELSSLTVRSGDPVLRDERSLEKYIRTRKKELTGYLRQEERILKEVYPDLSVFIQFIS